MLWILAILFLGSCAAPEQSFCGRAFCLSERPDRVKTEAPLPDLKVYEVAMHGQNFRIVEGSNLNTKYYERLGGVPPPQGFSRATVFRSENGHLVVLETRRKQGPEYVSVSAAEASGSDLEMILPMLSAKLD